MAKPAPSTFSFPLLLMPALRLHRPLIIEVYFLKNDFPKSNNTTFSPMLSSILYLAVKICIIVRNCFWDSLNDYSIPIKQKIHNGKQWQ